MAASTASMCLRRPSLCTFVATSCHASSRVFPCRVCSCCILKNRPIARQAAGKPHYTTRRREAKVNGGLALPQTKSGSHPATKRAGAHHLVSVDRHAPTRQIHAYYTAGNCAEATHIQADV